MSGNHNDLILAERDRLRHLVTEDGAENGDGAGFDLTTVAGDFDYWQGGHQFNVAVRMIGEGEVGYVP